MKHFEVMVDGWYDTPSKKPIRKRVRRSFIVEAATLKIAKTIALKYAEETAKFGPLWIGFEWIQTAPIIFPHEVSK